MKKYIGALVLLSVLAGLSGCQSKQVTAADAAIAAIGEVSLASEAQILQAESAVEALGPEERADLQNLQILQDARSVYDGLVLEDQADRISRQISALGEITPDSLPAVKAAEKAYADAPQPVKDLVKNHEQLEAARETLTALEAEKIERQIEDIGDVTLGSKSVVAAARKAYEEAAEAVREKIQNLHILQEAESRLRQLEEEDQLKQDQEAASRVEKEIQALGTIRYDSEEKIQAVQKAFDALSPGAKKLVSNVKKLQDAPAALVKAREQKLNANFARMRKDPDPFQNVVFYFPRAIPWGSNSWVCDRRSFILPYMAVHGKSIQVNLIYNCIAGEFIGMEKVMILRDGVQDTVYFHPEDVERNYSWGDCCESYNGGTTETIFRSLDLLSASNQVLVRFQGKNGSYVDMKMSQSDKQAIHEFVETCALASELGYRLELSQS